MDKVLISSIKTLLIILLLLCLLDMPYGYYQLARVINFVGFGYLAYSEYRHDKEGLALIFLASSLTFNPIFQLKLGKELWQIIDIFLSIILGFSILLDLKRDK